MQKMACIFSYKMSSWVSCQKIVFNLHKSYQLNKDFELLNFNYSTDQTFEDIQKIAKEIIAANPDTIVIMDHKPHPITLLNLILPNIKNKDIKIIFHIFGDFTLNYGQWLKLGNLLNGHSVEFIVASERQKILIDKFLPKTQECSVCPFPVNEDEFFYNPILRKEQRTEWEVKNEDLVFVFTGRLSRQKRILTLIRSFADFIESSKAPNAHLFLYGEPDALGDRFLGKWEIEGEYFRRLNRFYKSLPEEIQSRIHFKGAVPNEKLKAVYQGADYLVNLSVHNDEDYGMSVAEAQCSGLPAIITDWGGLAGFALSQLPEAVKFIPVKIGKRSKIIHYQSILKEFHRAYIEGRSLERQKISTMALDKLGIKACRPIIGHVLNSNLKKFTEFSPLLNEVISAQEIRYRPFLTSDKNINALYRELYSSYVRNN